MHSITLYASNSVEPRILVYGFDYCHSCISFKNFLSSNGFNYEYRDLTNDTYSREYLEITMLITNNTELSINDIVIPLTIIYDINGYPVAIIIGDIEDRGLIKDLLTKIYNGSILIVTETRVFELRSHSLEDKLRQLTGLHESNNVISPINFIPLMLGLALADSINPCAMWGCQELECSCATTIVSKCFPSQNRYFEDMPLFLREPRALCVVYLLLFLIQSEP